MTPKQKRLLDGNYSKPLYAKITDQTYRRPSTIQNGEVRFYDHNGELVGKSYGRTHIGALAR
jgi:hypothetical protein